jgi:hypothetical protein
MTPRSGCCGINLAFLTNDRTHRSCARGQGQVPTKETGPFTHLKSSSPGYALVRCLACGRQFCEPSVEMTALPSSERSITSFSRHFNNAILHRNWWAGHRRLCLKQTQGATHVISLWNIQTWYPLELPRRLLSTENQGICPAPRHPLGVFPPYLITMKYPPSRAVSRARLAAPTSERQVLGDTG